MVARRWLPADGCPPMVARRWLPADGCDRGPDAFHRGPSICRSKIGGNGVTARDGDESAQHAWGDVFGDRTDGAIGEQRIRHDRVRAEGAIRFVLDAEWTSCADVDGVIGRQAPNRRVTARCPGTVVQGGLHGGRGEAAAVRNVLACQAPLVAEEAGPGVIYVEKRRVGIDAGETDVVRLLRRVVRSGVTGAEVRWNHLCNGGAVFVRIPCLVPIDLLGDVVLLDVGEEARQPAQPLFRRQARCIVRARRKPTEAFVEKVKSEPDLLQVVGALRTRSGFAHPSGGGDQQGDEDRDDGNDYEQLDQGKCAPVHMASALK